MQICFMYNTWFYQLIIPRHSIDNPPQNRSLCTSRTVRTGDFITNFSFEVIHTIHNIHKLG